MTRSPFRRVILSLALAIAAGVLPAAARFALIGQPVPIPRLLDNVGKYVAKNPKDPQGYYTLGRIHSLAFARGLADMSTRSTGDDAGTLPNFPPYESIKVERSDAKPPSAEALGHLGSSLRLYTKATELDGKKSLYWLGLGWMLEQGTPFAAQVPAPFVNPAGAVPAPLWRDRALAAYRKAYELDRDQDLKDGSLGPGADACITLEAGEGILRLLKVKRDLAARERAELVQVQTTIDKLKLRPRVVTPIIFPLEGVASLDHLLAPETRVRFDLAGDTRAERWAWVSPKAGILVWDPQRTGRITSGAQLFGSVTWSMYWPDGYAPLAALDNDESGWLSGKELDGLAVWCDRNQNAVSEPGEVRPLRAHGITRVAVHAGGSHAGVPYQPRGLQRQDGSYLPTYDWTPVSIPDLPRPQ
jgi:hypothetical protein